MSTASEARRKWRILGALGRRIYFCSAGCRAEYVATDNDTPIAIPRGGIDVAHA